MKTPKNDGEDDFGFFHRKLGLADYKEERPRVPGGFFQGSFEGSEKVVGINEAGVFLASGWTPSKGVGVGLCGLAWWTGNGDVFLTWLHWWLKVLARFTSVLVFMGLQFMSEFHSSKQQFLLITIGNFDDSPCVPNVLFKAPSKASVAIHGGTNHCLDQGARFPWELGTGIKA